MWILLTKFVDTARVGGYVVVADVQRCQVKQLLQFLRQRLQLIIVDVQLLQTTNNAVMICK